MGTEHLYSDGYSRDKKTEPFSRKYSEDGIIDCPNQYWPVYGVLDGVSFYHPAVGPALFDGFTQGQLAVRLTLRTFLSAKPGELVTRTLITANNLIWKEAKMYGLSLEQPELLPGTNFALAQIGNEELSIVYGSDCGAVWQMKDGSIGGTINQAYDYEFWVEETFAAIKDKHGGDLNRAWEEWLPIRRDKIRQLQNQPGGWSTISGQPEFENSWEEIKFPIKEVKLIIIFTDGFVRFEDTKNPLALAQKLVRLYFKGGLAAILANTRSVQRKHLGRSHEATCPEATAMAIRLE